MSCGEGGAASCSPPLAREVPTQMAENSCGLRECDGARLRLAYAGQRGAIGPPTRGTPGLVDWESALLDSAVEVTARLQETIRAQAESLRQTRPCTAPARGEGEIADRQRPGLWVPKCPAPERLWEVIVGVVPILW